MRRRDVIALFGGAAAAPASLWSLAARAQQRSMPVIGVLVGGEQSTVTLSPAFRRGLSEAGFTEGRNVAFDMRATNQFARLSSLANELVQRQVAVIYAGAPANTALAAKAATATIPIVFSNGADPVRLGLVASFGRPGGNVTGVTLYVSTLVAKRLEMLRELAPQATTMAFLTNPTNLISEGDTADVQEAARSVGQQIIVLNVTNADEIDSAFATAARQNVGAMLVDASGFLFSTRQDQIIALAARYRIPASYPNRNFVEAGGLMSYADDRAESTRQSGVYVGRILKGEKPADLPVLQPTKFELVINLKAAKALGIELPPSFHLRATEVIE